jgi:hypothetical protein
MLRFAELRARRKNAKRSTGPKTPAGRARSSRNALRYGLSLPLTLNTQMATRADLITQSLVSEQAKPTQVVAAIEFPQARLDLARIRAVRGQMMAELDTVLDDLIQLRRLAALDRYEVRAPPAVAALKFRVWHGGHECRPQSIDFIVRSRRIVATSCKLPTARSRHGCQG